MATTNPFKTALQQGRRQFGLWLTLANAYCAEACATTGYDWLLIDAEHSPNDLNTVLAQLQAIAGHPSQPVVRPPMGDTWLIKQYLDLGARNLLIPMVETREQAQALVAAVRYPPSGVRGVGARLARASQFGAQADYLHHANDQICLLVQIETALGLSNLEQIAQVDGIDGVFIGPSDLSASLGHLGNPGHGDVQRAIQAAVQRLSAVGKPSGILSLNPDDARRYIDWGVCFVAVGSDMALMTDGARALRRSFSA